jgi:hypothetical protein
MLRKSLLLFVVIACPLVHGQSTFGGPAVISSNTSTIGQRSGQDVDLRFYGNATGVYDTGFTPYGITPAGTLLQPGGLAGVEVGLGGYGRHTFRRDSIGLDYTGNFRHYPSSSNYDGSNQQLSFNYRHIVNRRFALDFTEGAGTQNFGTAFGAAADAGGAPVSSNSLLFDNRTSYLQTSLQSIYTLSNRTTITMGGTYYKVHRQSAGLIGVTGYSLDGSIIRRLNRFTSIGATYQHSHYDYPRAFGEADINMFSGDLTTKLGRNIDLTLSGGVFVSDVQGVQSTALDPDIAALLGIGTVSTIFYKKNYLPMVNVRFVKRFRRSSLSANYRRSISNGNGVYLTSTQESYNAVYSYTDGKRLSFSFSGGSSSLGSIGQALVPYRIYTGSSNLTYRLGSGFSLGAGYSRRHQDLQVSTFRQNSSRVSLSIYFSPGEIPLSFH